MTFQDIFKSSFLENANSITPLDMVLALGLSFLLGLFIFLIYKRTYQGVMYSSSFAVTLVALTMITTVVILAVTSNVVLSLGMVGALSIAVGIVLAAGLIPLAVLGSVVIGVMLLVFVNRKSYSDPYILVLQCQDQDAEEQAQAMVSAQTRRCVMKSKSVRPGRVEINWEIRLKEKGTAFVNALSALEGVESAVLVSYNGDYMG